MTAPTHLDDEDDDLRVTAAQDGQADVREAVARWLHNFACGISHDFADYPDPAMIRYARDELLAVVGQASKADEACTRGEGPCMDCGTLNTPVWSAPNDLWNRVVGSPNGFLCPWCFTVRAEPVIGPTVWDLRPRQENHR